MTYPMLRLFDGSTETSPELNSDVKVLQNALNQYGFAVQADGIFGSETEAAVKQFQLDHNLYDDGIVGPVTWAALLGQPPPQVGTTFPTTFSSTNTSMVAQLAEAAKYKSIVENSAAKYSLAVPVIAGVGSRESAWGLLLKPAGPAGTGDFVPRRFPTAFRPSGLPADGGGFGRGLMQIDFDAFEFARTGNWQDPQANVEFGCSVFTENVNLIGRKSSVTGQRLLQAAIAAYNCGAGNVLRALQDGNDIDFYTAGRNYSADVLNRAGFFQSQGWS